MKNSIYILNTLEVGIDLINLLKNELTISGIIALKDKDIDQNKISGFYNQTEFCNQNNLPLIEVDSYELKSDEDKVLLLSLKIDILIISGWQRLIPSWLINSCKVSIGGHGSPFGITNGRGRSPQNWTLILGLKEFHFSIFKVDAGIDSGELIDTESFQLTAFDTINTSYKKLVVLHAKMLIKNIKSGTIFNNGEVQHQEGIYLPKRSKEDGQIDWNLKTDTIYNLIRALTKPYPGAYTVINNTEINIWRAIPFNLESNKSAAKGTVEFVYNDSTFIVNTGNGQLLIQEYSSQLKIETGMVFISSSHETIMKNIITQHESTYPNLPVHPLLLT